MATIDERLPVWRDRLDAWRQGDGPADTAATIAAREATRPALLDWLERLTAGASSLEDARVEFDQRTRTEWVTWGLKGASGAMFLNMLGKHLSRHDEVTAALLTALQPPPADADAAAARIHDFMAFIEGRIAEGDAARAQVTPNRAPFFLSSWWNIQDPDVPVYWRSALGALGEDGLHTRVQDRSTDYATFRRTYDTLRGALGLTAWELEGLCWWLEEQTSATAGGPAPAPAPAPSPAPGRRVWLIAPGRRAHLWGEWQAQGIAAIGWNRLGDLGAYPDDASLYPPLRALRADGKNPHNDVRACWQFAHEMKEGDLVFAKRGRKRVLAAGRVTGPYLHEPKRDGYQHVRSVQWTHVTESALDRDLVTKTLTDISSYDGLVRLLSERVGLKEEDGGGEEAGGETAAGDAPYGIDDALADLFLDRPTLESMHALLKRRRNLVLQGPPGTGKTYVASRLARLLIGSTDPKRVERVQFHQSMSYEDFVQGYRPAAGGGFERRDGPFLRFCNLAMQDQDNDYVLLIDEINRGNLSRILGELMLLIEPDKRKKEWGVTLSYAQEGEERFWVPPNLHIIGTMNTADRSLALVDYALRRRFAFVDLPSAIRTERFGSHLLQGGVPASLVASIRGAFVALNRQIGADPNLGAGFRIGHAYFCDRPEQEDAEVWYQRIVETEIAPLLREYWPDAPDRAAAAIDGLLEMS
jgi:hypothetical protein